MEETYDLVYDSVIHTTEKAALLDFGGSEIRVPFSLIHTDDDLDDAGGVVTVSSWFVDKEGLDGYIATE